MFPCSSTSNLGHFCRCFLYILTPIVHKDFHWRSNDSKSLQYFSTLFNILTDFSNTVLRMVSLLWIFSSSIPFTIMELFWTLPRMPIMMDIIATFMFHKVFGSLARSWSSAFHLVLILFFIQLAELYSLNNKSFFLFIIIKYDLLACLNLNTVYHFLGQILV